MSDKLFFPLLFAMNLAIRLHRLCLAVVKEDESVSSLLVKTSILPFCDLIVFPCIPNSLTPTSDNTNG